MPRLLFVILAGCASVGIIACGVVCFMYIQSRRRNSRYYYSFSMLPQKGEQTKRLFEDEEEEDGETELFRAPTKSKLSHDFPNAIRITSHTLITELQPYYDDEQDPLTDTEDDSEEEVVMLNSSFRS